MPPAETGRVDMVSRLAQLGLDARSGRNAMEADRARRDRVYLTPHRDLATAYAAQWSNLPDWDCHGLGALYLAEPHCPEEDPDFPGSGVQCPRARVVAVYDPVVILSRRKTAKIFLRYTGVRQVGEISMSREDYAALGVLAVDDALRRAGQ